MILHLTKDFMKDLAVITVPQKKEKTIFIVVVWKIESYGIHLQTQLLRYRGYGGFLESQRLYKPVSTVVS